MVKFGPSGNDKLFYVEGHKSTAEAFGWVKNLGLDLYEYSFGRGITLGDETAMKYGKIAEECGIEISVHAPYFVNLANPDADSIEKSFGYINNSLHKLTIFGGKKCVVHIGSCMKMTRDEALRNIDYNLHKFMENFDEKFSKCGILVCPEAMGRFKQIGTYQEIIDFCCMHESLVPTLDFGHINCLLQGQLNNKDEYRKILDYLFDKLGESKAKQLHIHFSKIEFTDKGEVKHLTLADEKFGPPFEPLAVLLEEYKMDETTVICESKEIMAQDAVKLKDIYETCKKNN